MFILLTAALLAATPDTFADRLAAAKPGDTVTLAAGDYGAPVIRKQSWAPALTIDARAARFSGLKLLEVEGLHIKGGNIAITDPEKLFTQVVTVAKSRDIGFDGTSFGGPGAMAIGLTLRESSDVAVENGRFSGLHRGIVFNQSQKSRVVATSFDHMRSDGIDIAGSQFILIDKISCTHFQPVSPDHPDCVQMWSRPGMITQDVTIRGSLAEGEMQGFSGFNHIRDGVDDGGFDRISIIGNTAHVSYPHGIALYSARDSVVRGNKVSTYPGSKYRASINVKYGNVEVSGNQASVGLK